MPTMSPIEAIKSKGRRQRRPNFLVADPTIFNISDFYRLGQFIRTQYHPPNKRFGYFVSLTKIFQKFLKFMNTNIVVVKTNLAINFFLCL